MYDKEQFVLKPNWQTGISCVACDVFSKGIVVLLPCYLYFFVCLFISEKIHQLFVILNALESSQNSDS